MRKSYKDRRSVIERANEMIEEARALLDVYAPSYHCVPDDIIRRVHVTLTVAHNCLHKEDIVELPSRD